MADHPGRRRGAVPTAIVWDILREATGDAGTPLEVLDAGGGTGGFAVPLAKLGHHVTVVDSSPDALAALERRAAESGVEVRALQGDADQLIETVGAESADLVLGHSVLEYVDDPGAAMAAIAAAVRPGGLVSLLAAGDLAAVVHRAMGGHFEDALRVIETQDGTWGDRDPMPRRFGREAVCSLAEAAGLKVEAVHGIRVFTDLVPGSLLDGEATEAMMALESAASTHPVLRDIAAQLHVLARR